MPLNVTKVWLRKTSAVGSLALAFMQVLYYSYPLRFDALHADVRWTGDTDLTNEPKLESLTENYLKNRARRLRNIAFNANATHGGEVKLMKTIF